MSSKKIADDVNRESCKDILEKIDIAARDGEYSIKTKYENLPYKKIIYLRNNGFVVDAYNGEYTIKW